MQFDQLRYFIAVAEEQNFRRAALRLNISQPPLSYQIKKLEQELNIRLLNRTTHDVSLTEAGAIFLDEARGIIRQVHDTVADMKDRASGRIGTLRVGFAASTALDPLFYQSIGIYTRKHPKVTIQFHEMTSEKQIVALEQRRIDVGLLRWTAVPLHSEFGNEILTHASLVLAIPEAHHLKETDNVSLKEVSNDPFVGYPQSAGVGTYRQFYHLCERAGFVPRVVQEASEVPVIMGLVAAGLGVAVVPSSLRSMQMPGVLFKAISDPEAGTTLDLVWRLDNFSPHLKAFREIVLEYCRAH